MVLRVCTWPNRCPLTLYLPWAAPGSLETDQLFKYETGIWGSRWSWRVTYDEWDLGASQESAVLRHYRYPAQGTAVMSADHGYFLSCSLNRDSVFNPLLYYKY